MVKGIIFAFLLLISFAVTSLPSGRELRTHDDEQYAALRFAGVTRMLCVVALVAGVIVLALLGDVS